MLRYPRDARRIKSCPDLRRARVINDVNRRGLKGPRRFKHAREHRLPTDGMQDLGKAGFHAGSIARSQYYDMQ